MRAAVALFVLAACRDELADHPELVAGPRILAVVADPAEAAPGEPLTLRAFVATPDGPAEPALDWAFCDRPKPLAENGAVDPACLTADLAPAGPPGIAVATRMPATACQLFGPEIPPQRPGEPPARPRDPDATGGYHQPLRVTLDGRAAIALVRVRCRLANAPFDVAQDFARRYAPNQSPPAPDLVAAADGALTAAWPEAAAEPFVRFDPARQALVDDVETLRATWYATAPLGEPADRPQASTVRPAAGPLHVWVVLRDDRGGAAVAHLARAN